MYLSIGWSRLMKCDRDIWKIYFACQKCLQNLAIKFSGNLVDFSKCDPYHNSKFRQYCAVIGNTCAIYSGNWIVRYASGEVSLQRDPRFYDMKPKL